MRMLRNMLAAAVAAVFVAPIALVSAQAETIRIGKVISGSGFHIPTYVAMTNGFFKAEGLDAKFVELTGKAQVTAGLSGSLDFVPIPSGGVAGGAQGRADPHRRRRIAQVAMGDRRAQGHQQARGPQGQDRRLRPCRRRRLRRGRRR